MPIAPVSVKICEDFSAEPGSGIIWTGVPPSGCTLQPVEGSPWPFNVGPPIHLPSPANVGIKEGLAPGTYCFVATCCPKKKICVTVK